MRQVRKTQYKRMCILADNRVYVHNEKYYSFGNLSLDIVKAFPGVEELFFVCRLYDNHSIEGMTEIDVDSLSPITVHFVGVMNQLDGIKGWIFTTWQRTIMTLKILRVPSVVYGSLGGPAGIIPVILCSRKKHFFVSRLLGELDVLLSMNRFRFPRLLTAIITRTFFIGLRKSNIQTWVSQSLEKRYALKNIPSVVYNDNHLYSSDIVSNPLRRDSNERLRVAYLGRLSPEKGIRDLINAFSLLSSHEILLSIIGAGVQEKELRELVREKNLSEQVTFYGSVAWGKELLNILSNHHLFVLPSYSEGLPTAIIEAMSCGLPVIATRVGSISEIVKDSCNGILVEPKRPDEIANAIEFFFNNEEKRIQYAHESINTAHENSRDVQLNRLQAAFEEFY